MAVAVASSLTGDYLASSPTDERMWRLWAEERLVALQQALVEAQAQARFQEARFTSLVEALPGHLVITTEEGHVVAANPSGRDWLEATEADKPGTDMVLALQRQFQNPAAFLSQTQTLRAAKQSRYQQEIALADGNMMRWDYLVLANGSLGHVQYFQPLVQHASEELAHYGRPMLQLSTTGQVLYANAAATALLATTKQGTSFDFIALLLPLVQQALRNGSTEQEGVQAANQYYHVQAIAAQDSAQLYFTDITAQRHVKSKYDAQQEFYEAILRELPVEVVVLDAEHNCCFTNARHVADSTFQELTSKQADAVSCPNQQLSSQQAEQRQRYFEQVLQTRIAAVWEETHTTADGRVQHMQQHYRPVYAADNSLRSVVAVGIDITERRQAEKQLADQQTFYEFALDQLPCDVGIFDNQFRYLYVNASGIKDPAVRKWVIGKDNFAYFARNKRPLAMAEERHARLEQAVRERRLVTYEETFFRPEGTRHQYRCLQPVFHPDGSLHLIIGYGLDVTDRVVTEQALRHAKLAAESAVRAREIFLANMSHEIRTPMNAILGMSQLLAKTSLTPTQSSYQQAISTSAENLLVIIKDILDLSKLEAGKMVLEQVGFSPTQLLQQVEQTLHYKAAEAGLTLRTQSSSQLPAVLLGDPHRIMQVLLNLTGNAIKFTEKGQVVVSCDIMSTDEGTAAIRFQVTDTGVGIDSAFLARIFQEFSQEDASVTRKFGGTGLGLSICRNLVKLMGSELQVTSQKQHGTEVQFTLHLPVGTATDLLPQALLPVDSSLYQELRHKHVLLVEDNHFNRQIAKTFLQHAHMQVTEAEHGAQAVALAQEQPFDVILMDIQMPVLDGYAATDALRQQLHLTTPIIALTANAIKGEREKCLAAGMNAYLTKPFKEAELLQVVSEWIAPRIAALAPTISLAQEPTSTSVLYEIDELLQVGQGDLSFVTLMLETFVESGEELLQALKQGLRERCVAQLKSAAHTLKPSLAHLHVWHLMPYVSELDEWQGEFQEAPLATLITSIEQGLQEVMTHMRSSFA